MKLVKKYTMKELVSNRYKGVLLTTHITELGKVELKLLKELITELKRLKSAGISIKSIARQIGLSVDETKIVLANLDSHDTMLDEFFEELKYVKGLPAYRLYENKVMLQILLHHKVDIVALNRDEVKYQDICEELQIVHHAKAWELFRKEMAKQGIHMIQGNNGSTNPKEKSDLELIEEEERKLTLKEEEELELLDVDIEYVEV